MAVLLDKNTRLLVQGLTGREGTFHARGRAEYGTTVVGGVTPGKGGTTHEGWPVFNTVADAVKETGANASVIFVPPPFAADAIMEAADAGVALVVCITEGIPTLDMLKRDDLPRGAAGHAADRPELSRHHLARQGQGRHHSRPHLPGGAHRHRVEERHADLRGHRSAHAARSGAVTCIGIGGDPLIGTMYIDALKLFAADARDRCRGHDRRDRRIGGGRSGRLDQSATSRSRSSASSPVRPRRPAGAWATRARSSRAARAPRRRRWRR